MGRVLLAAGLICMWIHPGTREVQVLTARMLLHLDGKTVVRGQPPGCVIVHVPNVQFSDATLERFKAAAATDVDAYLLVANGRPSTFPPAEAWAGHPALEWFSGRFASDWRFEGPPRGDRLEQIRKILVQAQAEDPSNGTLWLFEACVETAGNDPESVESLLRIAVAKGGWRLPADPRAHVRNLLTQEGWPELDAAIDASYLDPLWDLLWACSLIDDHLQDRLASAIAQSDETRMAELLSLVRDLGRCEAVLGPNFSGFRRFCRRRIPLDEAAKLMGVAPPESSGVDFETYEARASALRRQFVESKVDAETSRELLDSELPQVPQAPDPFRYFVAVELLGEAALFAFVLFWPALLMRLCRPHDCRPTRARRIATVVLLLMTLLLWMSFLHAVSQPTGLRSGSAEGFQRIYETKLWGTFRGGHVLVGIVGAAVFGFLNIMAFRFTKKRWIPTFLIGAFAVLYIASVAGAAWARYELARLL